MSAIARYVVDAVVLEHRSPSELARSHKVARSWIYKQLERFRKGGYAALELRSRRPRSPDDSLSPRAEGARPTLCSDHLAHPQAQRPGHPTASQAAAIVLHSV